MFILAETQKLSRRHRAAKFLNSRNAAKFFNTEKHRVFVGMKVSLWLRERRLTRRFLGIKKNPNFVLSSFFIVFLPFC